MSDKLKLISLNIEMNRHFERFLPFLEREKPDVICLQEVSEYDFPRLQKVFGMEGKYEPMMRIIKLRPGRALGEGTLGLALFCRFPATFFTAQYSGIPGMVPDEQDDNQNVNGILLGVELSLDKKKYVIATTHFTWTPDGQASPEQRTDMVSLVRTLSAYPEIVFCGDFNAPRGREMWEELASRYKDNIPPTYVSSIDPSLHRAQNLRYVVDGLFSSPQYRVSDVRLVDGVSDHMAVVGYVERTS